MRDKFFFSVLSCRVELKSIGKEPSVSKLKLMIYLYPIWAALNSLRVLLWGVFWFFLALKGQRSLFLPWL